jgi:hypothetical protein
MAKRKYGRIVSLASVAGFMSPIDLAPYGVAKSGIIGLTRSMALELAELRNNRQWITGSKWSGPLFFGLKAKPQGHADGSF